MHFRHSKYQHSCAMLASKRYPVSYTFYADILHSIRPEGDFILDARRVLCLETHGRSGARTEAPAAVGKW